MRILAVKFCSTSLVPRMAQASIRGSRMLYQASRKIPTKSSAKAEAARVVFSTRAMCPQFVAQHKDNGLRYSVDSVLCRDNDNDNDATNGIKFPEDGGYPQSGTHVRSTLAGR